jgi:antitoxin component YwqK of YwqJK toxin-antitoxin module
MIRYASLYDDIVMEIEIPSDANYSENNVDTLNKMFDKENGEYDTDKYIIRHLINIETKRFYKMTLNCSEKCDVIKNEQISYFKTYDRVISEISFKYLKKLKVTNRDDFPSVFRNYYHNGCVCLEFYHNKGVIEGDYIFYNINCNIHIKCNFINGKIHGECIIDENLYKNDGINNIVPIYKTYIFDNGKIVNPDTDYIEYELHSYFLVT